MDGILFYVAVFALGVGIAVVGSRWRRRWEGRASEGWPTVFGTIEQRYVDDEDRTPYATIAYSYSVNGEYYAGFVRQAFPISNQAEKFLENYPRDAKVMIRYNPHKPSYSVLRDEDQAVARRASG